MICLFLVIALLKLFPQLVNCVASLATEVKSNSISVAVTQLQPGDTITNPSTGASYRVSELIHEIGYLSGDGSLVIRPDGSMVSTEDGVCNVNRVHVTSCPLDTTIPRRDTAVSRNWRRKRIVGTGYNSNCQYTIEDMCGRGSHGEVWRARKIHPNGDEDERSYVVKRLFHDKPAALLSGFREIHFGLLDSIRSSQRFCRYVEHWQNTITDELSELWIVFYDEGTSLQRLLYQPTAESTGLQRTVFWRRIWLEDAGGHVFRSLARQLLEGLVELHQGNITHRDIKTSNLILGIAAGKAQLRFADFGSAVDDYALSHLYTDDGPTQMEESLDYAPPEVQFSSIPYDHGKPWSYDVFSAGIVLLELLFGRPPWQLFTLTSREEAILRHKYEDKEGDDIDRLLHVEALAKFCLRPSCSLEEFKASLLQVAEEVMQQLQTTSSGEKGTSDIHQTKTDSIPYLEGWQNTPRMKALPPAEQTQARMQDVFNSFAITPIGADSQAHRGNTLPALPYSGIPELEHVAIGQSYADTKPQQTMNNAHGLLSDDLISLLYDMLQWDPNNRITALQGLVHAYFNE